MHTVKVSDLPDIKLVTALCATMVTMTDALLWFADVKYTGKLYEIGFFVWKMQFIRGFRSLPSFLSSWILPWKKSTKKKVTRDVSLSSAVKHFLLVIILSEFGTIVQVSARIWPKVTLTSTYIINCRWRKEWERERWSERERDVSTHTVQRVYQPSDLMWFLSRAFIHYLRLGHSEGKWAAIKPARLLLFYLNDRSHKPWNNNCLLYGVFCAEISSSF